MSLDLVGRILKLFGVNSARVADRKHEVVHRVSESFHVTDPATGRVQTYADRSELPDFVRQALDQATQTSGETTSRVEAHHEFHIAGVDGSVRVYNSLDEMPTEIRRFFG
ncbi:MAG: hypothetical protein V3U67_01335 [Gemmatimonadota bacterium]